MPFLCQIVTLPMCIECPVKFSPTQFEWSTMWCHISSQLCLSICMPSSLIIFPLIPVRAVDFWNLVYLVRSVNTFSSIPSRYRKINTFLWNRVFLPLNFIVTAFLSKETWSNGMVCISSGLYAQAQCTNFPNHNMHVNPSHIPVFIINAAFSEESLSMICSKLVTAFNVRGILLSLAWRIFFLKFASAFLTSGGVTMSLYSASRLGWYFKHVSPLDMYDTL